MKAQQQHLIQTKLWNGLKQQQQTSTYLVLMSCLIIALGAAFPLWGPGIINTRGGGDSPFLLQRTLDMAENIKQGAFPPRWMAHAAYNYGYPFFNHYGALPFYISGGLTAIGVPVILAIQSTQTLGFVLSAFAMALWAQHLHKNQWAIILSVAAYTYAPFHLVNVYVRGDSLSEFYAFIWFPLILWALQKFISKPTWLHLFITAGAYGGLILTHNTSTVAFSPFALLYALFLTYKTHGLPQRDIPKTLLKKYIVPVILPFLLGVLLTMWFWLPAIVETSYGQLNADFTEGYFHFSQHFRGLNLVQSTLTFDYSTALKVADSGPFAMGFLQALCTILGIFVLGQLLIHRVNVWEHVYLCVALLMATLMMTPLSAFLWENIDLLGLTQFPWRFLSIQAVYTAAVTGAIPALISKPGQGFPSKTAFQMGRVIFFVGIGIVLICGSLYGLQPDRLQINNDDVTWDTLSMYETFTGNIGTTIRYEYLPKDVVPRPYITQSVLDRTLLPKADGTAILQAQLIKQESTLQQWEIQVNNANPDSPKRTTVVFPLYWWPGWQATMNGEPALAYAFTGSGQLALDIPEGTHEILLHLHMTPLQRVALIISIVSSIVMLLGTYLESRRYRQNLHYTQINGTTLFFLAACILSLVLPIPWHQEYASVGTYFDFSQMPFLHTGPIEFEQATLNYSDISTDTVVPGETIGINMQWSIATSEPLTATIRIVLPAEPRHNVSYMLAETQTLLTPTTNINLELPEELSRGLYLIQVRVYNQSTELKAITPQGRGMGTLYIGAIRVLQGPKFPESLSRSEQPTLQQFTDIDLLSFEFHQPEPQNLTLDLAWTTAGTARNWSLSVRLLDFSGQLITQLDTQPGYGYLPTSIWNAGEIVYDVLHLVIPEGTAPGDYTIRIISYLQATMETGGEIDIPIHLDKPTLYDLRNSCCEQTRKGATILCQVDGIALLAVDSPNEVTAGQNLSLFTEWNAVQKPSSDITAQWSLVSGDNERVIIMEGPLAAGSPTSIWTRHTWVLSPFNLVTDRLLEPGKYNLQITLSDGQSDKVECHIKAITVTPRNRLFTIPDIPHLQQVQFNDEISLLGYDTEMNRKMESLRVTLWWQAETTPKLDYKRFIHLYELTENRILTQDDAMPRDWTYPTTWWDEGEIISETITLSLKNIPKGTYELGIGWYNPVTMDRLPVSTTESVSIDDNRVTLSAPIKIR